MNLYKSIDFFPAFMSCVRTYHLMDRVRDLYVYNYDSSRNPIPTAPGDLLAALTSSEPQQMDN